MAQVIVRNLDDTTVARLKARAKRNGRSLEAELRAVLTQSVSANDASEFMEWVRGHRLSGGVPPDAGAAVEKAREERTRAILEAALGADR